MKYYTRKRYIEEKNSGFLYIYSHPNSIIDEYIVKNNLKDMISNIFISIYKTKILNMYVDKISDYFSVSSIIMD